MTEWKVVKISELGEVVGGATPSTSCQDYYNGEIPWLTPKDLADYKYRYISRGERNITNKGLDSCSTKIVPKNTVLFTSRAPIGYVAIASNEMCTNQGFKSVIPNDKTDFMFLYYLLVYNKEKIESVASGTTFKEVSGATMRNIEVRVPSLDVQKKIAKILSALDDKIELNNRINKNLEAQAQAIYKHMFVENNNFQHKACHMEEYFEISIGKTPPRKEQKWFSTNSEDFNWVSISDMGNCGIYIGNSSEKITREAVDCYNIKVVPDNTVLLSFKLTVGRVAITYGEMTTNEAIAHFNTNRKEINEYLYFYLKSFNYQMLGSTSSIATAVNSKIIKEMQFIVPTEDEIMRFHNQVSPMFKKIKLNQIENVNLVNLRDTLLPKLMSGELNVSSIDLGAIV